MVLNKALLALAMSASVAMFSQVSATETTTVQEQVEATGATAQELEVAKFLATEVTAGRMTLNDVSALTALQERRDQRGQVIRWVVVGTVAAAIIAVGGYFGYKYLTKDAKADDKSKSKADDKGKKAKGKSKEVVAEEAAEEVVAEEAAEEVVAEEEAEEATEEEVVAPRGKGKGKKGRKGAARK